MNKLSISESELKEKMISLLSGIELPSQIFTPEECAGILLLEMHQDRTALEEIYKTAENRYKISYPQKYNAMLKRRAEMNQREETLKAKAIEENKIYDTEWEKEIERETRANRTDALSHKTLDRLTLETMEESYNYRHARNIEASTSSSASKKEHLYTKWGVYEMPEPYKINITRGPRNDLKRL